MGHQKSYVRMELGPIGSTILLYKENSDEQNLHNWRLITIFSEIHKIIKKTLDQALRARTK